MSILIFANGNLKPGDWVKTYLSDASLVIAADGGLHHLRALGRRPDVLIGDLDSVEPSASDELQSSAAELIVHPKDKDASDLELALQYAVANHDEEILIFGGLGGRLDQLLANVLLLTQPHWQGRAIYIVEEHQRAWIITAGSQRFEGDVGDLFSMLPLDGDAHIRRTDGLQWQLQDESLIYGQSRGISNILTADTVVVEVQSGILLCIHTRQGWQR